MLIDEVMSKNTEVVKSTASVKEVANRMAEFKAGLMPIYEDDKLIGTVTDRDLVIEAIAKGKTLEDKISSIVSEPVLYCFKDDDTETVLNNMRKNGVQRLVVLDNQESKRLVGIVSLADIASKCDSNETAKSIVDCCKHYH
ncbi:CBS domain-containing protein [Alteromonas lipotrueiana]|uniref:CBS domain-containing protein n=1 Tax=Alteromonas lipotrueiana TaxID=2803815 RepID=UPI001C48AB4F|nr:CBS domain-containing protein [Alteromonas lipotrueiana]